MDIVLPPDFKKFLKLLNDKNIQYLLIGGYAVGYHRYPRATNNISNCINLNYFLYSSLNNYSLKIKGQ